MRVVGIRRERARRCARGGAWRAVAWLACMACGWALPAAAAIHTVTSAADAGSGSLREALTQALASSDAFNTIWFAPALDGQTISLTTFTNPAGSGAPGAAATRQFGPAAFFISGGKSILIDATHRLAHGVTIERASGAQQAFRLFDVDGDSALSLRGVTLRGGHAKGGDAGHGGAALGAGGAIFNRGTVSIEDSTLVDNTAQGGAVLSASSATGGGGVGGAAVGNDGGSPNGGTLSALVGWGGGGRIPSDPPQFGGGGAGLGAPGSTGSSGGTGGFGAGGGGGPTPGGAGFGGGAGCANGGGSGAGMGGAIFNDAGTVVIGNSTLSGNRALGGANEVCTGIESFGHAEGGAIFNYSGRLDVSFSTLVGNAIGWAMSNGASGMNDGGAIYGIGDYACAGQGNACGRDHAQLLVAASIVTGNTVDSLAASGAINDIAISTGAFALLNGVAGSAGDRNMIGHEAGFAGSWLVTGVPPQLGALADHGGPAWTLLPAATSPVIDRIDPAQCPERHDQRGVARPQGSACDIGAVEYRGNPQLTVSVAGGGSVGADAAPAPVAGGIVACTATGGGCTATYAGEGSAPQAVTLHAIAAGGANFVSWSGDCSGGNPAIVVTMAGARSCHAQFTAAPVYALTASVDGGHGAISPATQSVPAGATAQFALLPDPGYRVAAVSGTCGGTLDAGGGTFTTSPVQAACTVVAQFAPNLHQVAAAGGAGGAVAPTLQVVAEGATATLAVSPLPGMHVGAIGGTCPQGNLVGNGYASGAIVADCTITIGFEAILHTVTASTDAHGSITPPTQNVAEGSSATLTILADPGYHLAGVDGSCGGQANGATYTTAPISADCTVHAHFAADPTAVLAVSVCVWGSDGTCTAQDDYAAYGASRLYVVTVSNAGAAAANDVMLATAAPGLDDGATSWVCIGAAGASCTAAGSGPLVENAVSVPAGGSLSWLVTSQVREDAAAPTLVYQATLSRLSAPVPNSTSQTAWLVILRNGFEASGAAATATQAATWSGQEPFAWPLPTAARDGLQVLLRARAPDGAGFRVERLCVGATCWLRLLVSDASGVRASGWQPCAAGAQLQLHTGRAGEASLLLDGGGVALTLPLHARAEGWQIERIDPDQ